MDTHKILIVDDELYHLEIIMDVIEREGGESYQVLQALNGKTAFMIAKKEIPNLIITDWEMPEIDGIEFIQLLKKEESTMDIPVIMCSGKMTSSENLNTALKAGAADFVRKPIDKIELIARIQANIILGNSIRENKKLIKAKDKFFSILSHDLRGPIGSISAFIDEIIDNLESFERNELVQLLNLISEQGSATLSTLENLFTWAKSQRGGIELNQQKQLLYDTININVQLLSTIANKKGISLINEIPKNIEVVYDKILISTTIRNLIANAIKFTPKNGSITIKLEEKSDHFIVSVIDTGIGIDDKSKKMIFEKSNYLTTYGTSGEKGSGLGLKVCIDFIRINGGKLVIDSQLGKGSTFSFTMPKYDKVPAQDQSLVSA
ncbi:MAG: hybrid sensor histidine kinase/response regulator [Bacteroidales bacterium]|nr:hybrid sensor histidine kinase/response regulator [Bacteroidales bacterium]